MKLTHFASTVDDLRAFLAHCDDMNVPGTATLHAKTRFGMQSQGPPLKELTVDTGDGPTEAKR